MNPYIGKNKFKKNWITIIYLVSFYNYHLGYYGKKHVNFVDPSSKHGLRNVALGKQKKISTSLTDGYYFVNTFDTLI